MVKPTQPPSLFSRVPEPLWAQILNRADRLQAAKGDAIYDRKRFRRCLGVVLRGRIQVRRETLLMSTLSAGDVFGAAALFNDGEDYPTTLTALTGCEVLLIPQESVRLLLRTCGDFAEDYAVYLSGRIRFLSTRLEAVSAGSAQGKLAQYLLDNAGSGELTLSATQLCQRLGVGRATLYRAFDRLEETGAIAREGKTIRVLDKRKLHLCNEDEKEGRSS